ncbi:MAG: Actin cross-linking toxin VgrG1 [Burkholderia lata]|uniref:Actin cross-linking toxin VgrG1 n=1 Tax=Burkholderia lata (strain ATCC 17760 / DSM 23089 / LMG 22485 / NCIMB 9086 / R18194 / 383) TaxID=482957 RepID=A0A833PQB0_BURL3|nr:type VI secretion system Vgr family protein [Burkholderia lata]KAF1034765.1 MAG: Actin cross-linking toxin VgrG1 [Burkholderia lata]
MALLDVPRTLSVSGAALPMYGGQSILTPMKLTGGEIIGELFEYTLELKTPDSVGFSQSIAANVDLDALIGTEVTVSIQLEGKGRFIPGLAGAAGMANVGAGMREITGVVSHATIVREDGRSIVYELTLRPWLWHATKNCDCRIFQDMSVVEITDAVLSVYPFPVEKRLTTPRPNKVWPKRDIQRQHLESDWTFLQRLWEEWGIYYFFEHDEGKHRLVLCDSMGALKPLSDAYAALRYDPPTSRRIDEEHIHEFSVSHALTKGAVTSVDYDYTLPRANLKVTREDPRDTGLAHQEQYSWGDYAQPQAGAAGLSGDHNEPRTEAEYLTLVQMQAWRCQGLRAYGKGNLRGLVTGQTFVLAHYPQDAANREYAVVGCMLTIEDIGEASGSGQRYRCEADFTLQPTNEPFRLLRTIAKPRMTGVEYAVVTCPENQEIWTDAYGRVKLQFLWDRLGNNDERSSCWVRVAGAWHGDQFGGIFLPRRGHEVEVAFVNGDPDLPIIVGSATNAFNMPPFALPENQTLAGYRSREVGGRRANTLAFDDTNGKIQTHLSSDEGASQLNLGYITRIAGNAGRQDERGRGAELRTDGHGVFRAGQGMLLTTEVRQNAQAHVTDMGETTARLEEAERWQTMIAELAQQATAQEANSHQEEVAKTLAKQNAVIGGSQGAAADGFSELGAPHVVIAGAAGIQTTTPATTHIASGQHVALTSGEHIAASANGSVLISAQDSVRQFAARGGMKSVAADGNIDIHALQKAINLLAMLEVNVTSDTIHISAKKKLVLNGGGSYIELEQGSIKSGTSGVWLAHAANHYFPQPDEVPVELHVPKVCIECLLKAAKSGASAVPRL